MGTEGLSSRDIDLLFQSRLFKVLSEPVRLELLRFLAVHGECDISTAAKAFPQDRSVISRHLKLLAESGLLFIEKRGRNTFYALNGFAFLKSLEEGARGVRTLLEKACPEEYARYLETGEAPAACSGV